jgi:hypothetical protein
MHITKDAIQTSAYTMGSRLLGEVCGIVRSVPQKSIGPRQKHRRLRANTEDRWFKAGRGWRFQGFEGAFFEIGGKGIYQQLSGTERPGPSAEHSFRLSPGNDSDLYDCDNDLLRSVS